MKKVVIDGIQYGVRDDEVLVLGYARGAFVANVIIPASIQEKPVRQIRQGAFRGTNIETIQIPTTIHHIHKEAFYGCKQLTDVSDYFIYQIYGTVYPWMHIYDKAFAECENLKKVNIRKEVGYLTDSAFAGCRNLCVLNAKIGTVRKNVFQRCSSLTEISFGRNGKICNHSIEDSAIKKITAWKELNYTQSILRHMRKNQIKICCQENSKLLDLAYIGCDVEII